ncbi:hypothetical protein LQ327_01715 [Actinomycetospora endophytica]|uniref:Alpha/beta hydrolase family protein n=1 Tax=Actinomycetospora endophytica TaxID=2291215 RepID=A0ABS8P201_9PSEU|nr:hypothetical protein [Actinomycetospora endophytica]MCD2192109.1 hypothetical protein [Actinomycetospora endophytica]
MVADLLGEVLGDPRDHHDDGEVDEELEPGHRPVPALVLVGAQDRMSPDARPCRAAGIGRHAGERARAGGRNPDDSAVGERRTVVDVMVQSHCLEGP